VFLFDLKTKSDIWKYEKEVRITGTNFSFNKDLINFIKLAPGIITDVYIGINITQKDIDEVVKVAKVLSPDIAIFKMQADYTLFNLVPDELVFK